MHRFELTNCRTKVNIKRVLFLGLSWLLTTGSGAMPSAASAKPQAEQAGVAAANRLDPETLLIEVYKELGANRLRAAQEKADRLVEAYPNFRLGHLIRGDLLLMHTRPVNTLGAVNGPQDKLKNLREEAMVRLKSLRERPDPALIPRSLLQLREDQKHALVVDAKRSRLYVYENQGGRPKLVTDYYISQGKLGVNKLKAGDQKTPVGIYYITSHLPGARLPDFYGSGALPINYPNEWDKLNGRSGSGIWLHGTPSDTYSRPPRASDGCIVLANTDLDLVAGKVRVGSTPVVIADELEWVPAATLEAERKGLADALEAWRADWESRDTARYLSHYAAKFHSGDQDLPAWAAHKRKVNAGKQWIKVGLNRVSMFRYPREKFVVVGFDQDYRSSNLSNVMRKRQYWVREGARWKILYEGGA